MLAAFVISYRKNSRVDLFQSFCTSYQLVLFRESHCHLSEQSFSLVKHSAHARAIFRGFANSREKSSGSRHVKMTHCTSYLYATLSCLHCGRNHGCRKRKHAFFSLRRSCGMIICLVILYFSSFIFPNH